jgi:hypothetical protein
MKNYKASLGFLGLALLFWLDLHALWFVVLVMGWQ